MLYVRKKKESVMTFMLQMVNRHEEIVELYSSRKGHSTETALHCISLFNFFSFFRNRIFSRFLFLSHSRFLWSCCKIWNERVYSELQFQVPWHWRCMQNNEKNLICFRFYFLLFFHHVENWKNKIYWNFALRNQTFKFREVWKKISTWQRFLQWK